VAWLRNLAAAGHISPGRIDGRSIKDVRAADLTEHTRAHFFAGVGGWERALDLASVPADLIVWTGSCPCQPFSSAGSKRGTADERHLWPVWRRLIDQCKPAVIFGEQVASPLGREWLAAVRADLEALGYVVGAADLCAAGAGAPHIRQRLWFGAVHRSTLADPQSLRRLKGGLHAARHLPAPRQEEAAGAGDGGSPCGLADSHSAGLDRERPPRLHEQGARRDHDGGCGPTERLADAGCPSVQRFRLPREAPAAAGEARSEAQKRQRGRLAHRPGSASRGLADMQSGGCGVLRGTVEPGQVRHPDRGSDALEHWPSSPAGDWSTADWLLCRDAKWRPVEPGTFPLVDGLSTRVGRLRAYGNAIVPQVAAAFVEGFFDSVIEAVS
jgi:DNA (cytosine-5)-methyltransferase 1